MADNEFQIKIIAPDRIFYEGEATMVEFTTTEGDIGVLKNHIPLTTVLAPGVITITEADDSKKYAGVYAGFVEILGESVTILAETAEWPDEIDVDRAQAAEKRARDRIETKAPGLDLARADIALKKSLVRQNLVSRL